jgi:hypothetical protein
MQTLCATMQFYIPAMEEEPAVEGLILGPAVIEVAVVVTIESVDTVNKRSYKTLL